MDTVLNSIALRLKEYEPVIRINRPDRTRILRFSIWEKHDETWPSASEDTLYYVDEALLRTDSGSVGFLPCNLLCCSEEDLPCPADSNLIHLTLPTIPQELTSRIGQTLSQIAQYEMMMAQLPAIMEQPDAVQEMIDCFSRCMNLYTYIYDTSFKRIAVTSTCILDISFPEPYDRLVREDYLSDASIALISEFNRLTNTSDDASYIISDYQELSDTVPVPDQMVSGIALSVCSGGQAIAVLSASSAQRKLDLVDVSIVQDFGRLLALVLIRDATPHNDFHAGAGAILHDVITGTTTDENLIRMRLHTMNYSLPEVLYAASLISEHALRSDPSHDQRLQQEFMAIVPGCICDVYQGHPYFLIGRARTEAVLPSNEKRLRLFLRTQHLHLGISAAFHVISKLKTHFLQSLSAASVGCRRDPAEQIYRYESYTIELSIDVLMRSADLDPASFCHPVILSLYESTRPADRELLDTLRQYLFCLQNVTKTCEELHIHRSTFYYRLDKIKDLLGKDSLDDGKCVLRLMYSFEILRSLHM